MTNMAIVLYFIIGVFILKTGIFCSIIDESKCSKFEYEYKILERIIFLENKNAEVERKQVVLERKNEELVEIVKEQRIVMEEKDKELEESQAELTATVRKSYIEQNRTQNKLSSDLQSFVEALQKGNRLTNNSIGFTARLAANHRSYGNGQTVVFDDVIANVGGGYSPGTGIFTCPMEGMYLLSATLFTWNKDVRARLVKNGEELVRVWANSDASHHDSSSNLVYVSLDKGDLVCVKLIHSGGAWAHNVYGRGWDTFSGILIHQLLPK